MIFYFSATGNTRTLAKTLATELDEKVFDIKGNAIDMAVGIIIGAAFGKVVDSLVKDNMKVGNKFIRVN